MNSDDGEASRKRKAEDIAEDAETDNRDKKEGKSSSPDIEEVKDQHEKTSEPAKDEEDSQKVTGTATIGSTTESSEPGNPNDETKSESPVAEETKEKVAEHPTSTPASPQRPKNEYDDLRWIVVKNDGQPESMIKLIGLKSLFAKQLPKMPRAYIARLVLDRRHTSLAILSDKPELKGSDEEIIGGICYRAFPEMRFAGRYKMHTIVSLYLFSIIQLTLLPCHSNIEIAFCAVNATHQVKGYGSKLMNLLKSLAVKTGIEFFITYAGNYVVPCFTTTVICSVSPYHPFDFAIDYSGVDNYAIGYFKKQGFTKSITMPKGRYTGLIKEYDGGTPMECYVHPSIDFTRIPEMIKGQREYILNRVRLTSNSHRVYEPLPNSFYEVDPSSRGSQTLARALAIPGISEAGWTMADLRSAMGQSREVDRQKVALKADLLAMLRRVEEQQFAWPFREPVDTAEVPDYLNVIKQPIDLSTMEKKIRQDNYYRTKEMFFSDLILVSCLLVLGTCDRRCYQRPSDPCFLLTLLVF